MPGPYQRKKHNWGFILLCSVLVAVNLFLAVLVIDSLIKRAEDRLPTESALQTDGTQASTEAETSSPTTRPVQTEPEEPTTTPTETTVPTETAVPTETTVPTEPATAPTEPTTTPVEPTTEAVDPPQQPSQLTALLENNGITFAELAQNGCTQLVTVAAGGTTAQIRFFTCEEGIWEEKPELNCQGRVGRNGVAADKQEGDGCTPTGLYGIGSAFYIQNLPDTGLDTFQITDKTYWVDDPNSRFYNQKVEGTQNKDWNSAEHMISYDVYRYGFVVEYNLQAEKNAGSAIFFHLGNTPTSGCIATGESMVLAYLKELDKEQNPHILIVYGNDT